MSATPPPSTPHANATPGDGGKESLTLRFSPNTPENRAFQAKPAKPDNQEVSTSGDAQTNDQMAKGIFTAPQLYNCWGDISRKREWHVHFNYSPAPGTEVPMQPTWGYGRARRFRIYKGFADCKTLDELQANAEALIQQLTGKLKSGWNPCFGKSGVVYHDHISKAANRYRLREAKFNIEYSLNEFIDQRRQAGLRYKSVRSYTTKLRALTNWLIENKLQSLNISQFNYDHVRQFMSHISNRSPLGARGKHNRTINSYKETLRTCWNWFIEKEYIEINPWNKWKSLKYTSTSKRPFNKEQRASIREELLKRNDSMMQLACDFVYYCFIRNGVELSGLQVKHIDMVTNQIRIPGEISKNKKTETVGIPAALMEKLHDLKLNEYAPDYYILGAGQCAPSGVRGCPSPTKAGRDYWSKRFTKIIRDIGFSKDYTMYSWKHTGNQVAHANGMPLKQQQRQNRHHSLDQMSTYLDGLEILKSIELQGYFVE